MGDLNLSPEERKELRDRTGRLVEITREVFGGERVSSTEHEIDEGLIFVGRVFDEERSQPMSVYVFGNVINIYSPTSYYKQEAEKLARAYGTIGEEFRVEIAESKPVKRFEMSDHSRYL